MNEQLLLEVGEMQMKTHKVRSIPIVAVAESSKAGGNDRVVVGKLVFALVSGSRVSGARGWEGKTIPAS